MNNNNALLLSEFEILKNEVIARYNASGNKASGNWATTVQVEATAMGAALTAADYLEGRKPGKQPPSKAIEQWLRDKGVAEKVTKSLSISSLAYIIARKIAKHGWQPKQSGSDIIESVATPQRIQQIIDKAGEALLAQCTTQILDYLKQAAT